VVDGAFAAGSVAFSSAGIATVLLSPSAPTTTFVDHSRYPGATTAMVCSPGSMGAKLPSELTPTSMPSRLTTSPGISAPGPSMRSFESFGSSRAARFAAFVCCAGRFCRRASSAAALNSAHADAVLPIFS
jgi:hypothetical protein